ncbi:PucR family transcriptional regulator ligand-binding domain-containing protein [Oscillatoria sp. CS-180]|uniref:PucR family transcriptional regulator n=1 Tax=Oscillatoria sp. CS-180 TaxID=3021720 RepID=UPI00232F368F|nr:PucR family transcriptional regulator [Oscillatoria sp. CS-180]MDB9529667.1 PucR family transcriptional regulator ligand-binding domain-containing protein [Oscillatoria sp. CS-180]
MNTFTVQHVLDLPLFAASKLVAGKSGLANIIHWVHVVDLTNAHYKWQRQGVLLLTSGLGFYENPGHQKTLIPRLVQLGFAGLVLSTGHYFEHTPESVRSDADRLGFPIIETPPDLLFIQITEVVLEHIINQNYTVLQRSAQISQQLTQLVLQGASWHDLVATLARLLQRSVAIELPTLQIAAAAQWGDVDAAWREKDVQHVRSPSEIVSHLVRTNVHESLQQTHRPQTVPPQPELGMTLERMVAPIIVDQDLYGYIWLLSGSHPFTSLDEQALVHGATVAGLILAKEEAVRCVKVAQQGDFLTQLFDPQSSPKQLQEQAQQLSYHLDAAHQVVVVRLLDPTLEMAPSLQTTVQQVLMQADPFALLACRENTVIVVLEGEHSEHGQQFADRVLTMVDCQAQPLVMGLGDVCVGHENRSGSLKQSYEQAQEAAHIGVLLEQTGAIAFNELGLLHWLYHLAPHHRADNPYLSHVRTLATHDARRGSQLLNTLEAYLDRGQSVAESAEALYVHRNTLLNRLDRIESLCGLNLRDATQRLNLNVAVKCYRLHG